jgi:ring-1,2-phenylacetyl-CoA epoxidase subunit PaaC
MTELPTTPEALKDLLLRLADDDLLLGHRNSEWTGLGPLLEEDIAFASMAQDQIGHALAYFELLEALGAPDPDTHAFTRQANAYRACHLVVAPMTDYAFSLVRHYLYDTAKAIRLKALTTSTYAPLAALSQKIFREHKYHVLHARTWLQQLARGTDESRLRVQSALNEACLMAFGLWEPTVHTDVLAAAGVQPTEAVLQEVWLADVAAFIESIGLQLPTADYAHYMGGRNGYPSEHLAALVAEMGEVLLQDSEAVW